MDRARRALLLGLCAALIGPAPAWAQGPSRVARVAVFTGGTAEDIAVIQRHYGERFAGHGFAEGRSFTLEIVNIHGQPQDGIEKRARELVASRPDVIMTPGTNWALMFKRLTRDIPVVFMELADPVGLGLVENLRRPGGNFTGAASRNDELIVKRLELLKELVPSAKRVAILTYDAPIPASILREFESGARQLGLDPVRVALARPTTPAAAAQALRNARADVVYCAMSYYGSADIVRNPDRLRLPAVFFHHHTVDDGGLISLGEWWLDPDNRAIDIAARILRGADPATIPVNQLDKPYLAVNLKTARTLGIEVPKSILTRADHVIP